MARPTRMRFRIPPNPALGRRSSAEAMRAILPTGLRGPSRIAPLNTVRFGPSVPEPWLRGEQARLARLILELPPQRRHVDPDVVALVAVPPAPHATEEEPVGEQLAGV